MSLHPGQSSTVTLADNALRVQRGAVRPVTVVVIDAPVEDQPQVPFADEDQLQLAELAAGHQPGRRGRDRPVGPGQPRRLDLALEHGDLMTQDEDLGVLGAAGPGEQGKPAEYPEHRQVGEWERHES